MDKSKIGAQLYTVRDFTQKPEDIVQTMEKISEAGYEAVQLSALGPMETGKLKEVLDENQLRVAATHRGFGSLRDETEAIVEEHRILDCDHVAIGSMPGEYRNEEGFHRFAREGSEVAEKLARAGLTFSYHNHSFEFEKFGEKTGFEILVEESDPDLFNLELDTFWVQHGGADPAAWIKRLKGRIPLLHLKDMTIEDGEQLMAEVGEGNLNWDAILESAAECGTEWYLVEQDVCQRDPFESLSISLENLKEM